MRDTLLRTEIMMVNEEHNTRDTNPRDPIVRIIQIMEKIRRGDRTVAKIGVHTETGIGVLTGIETGVPTGTKRAVLTVKEMVARENAALEWGNGFNRPKEVRAVDMETEVGEINPSIREVDRKEVLEVPKRSSKRKNRLNRLSIKRTPIRTRRSA